MKKLIVLLLLVIPIITFSSGIQDHLIHSSHLNDFLFDYFEENSNINMDVIGKESLERNFYLGSIYPDIYRWIIENPILLTVHTWDAFLYTLSGYIFLDPSIIIKLVIYDISSDEIARRYYQLKNYISDKHYYTYKSETDSTCHDYTNDFHVHSAMIIEMMNNDDFIRRDKAGYCKDIFFLLGMLSHNIEDTYVDLFWHTTLSDQLGFGDFTEGAYTPLKSVETYLD